jgi:hypothetical protein
MSNGFDLSSKSDADRHEAGAVIHLENAAGEPMYFGPNDDEPVTVSVMGTLSHTYRRVEAEIRRRPIRARKFTQATTYDEIIEKVSACTFAWAGVVNAGTPVECNRANAERLFRNFPRALDQAWEGMQEDANFSPSASQS